MNINDIQELSLEDIIALLGTNKAAGSSTIKGFAYHELPFEVPDIKRSELSIMEALYAPTIIMPQTRCYLLKLGGYHCEYA